MVCARENTDPDLNKYDSFHETMRHPNFAPGEWYVTYRKAWLSFYSFEHIRHVLADAYPENCCNIFRNFIGISKQRVHWFAKGFETGAIDQCNTFEAGGY